MKVKELIEKLDKIKNKNLEVTILLEDIENPIIIDSVLEFENGEVDEGEGVSILCKYIE